MDGEVTTLLNNSLAMLQEIKQMVSVGQTKQVEQPNMLANENMTKAAGEDQGSAEDENEDIAEMAKKALVQSDTDSADANDNAEDIISEQQPEETEENAKEVAKQLLKALNIMSGKIPVKKSVVNPS